MSKIIRLRTRAEDNGEDEAWIKVRGKGAVKLVQLEVQYDCPWMPVRKLTSHLRQLADQIEARWPNLEMRP